MTDPVEGLVPEGCKAIELAIAPATVLSDLHKKNPVLDMPQELEVSFLVIDARKHDANDINAWIRAYMEAEKNYPEFTPQIAIIGQAAQDAIKLPGFDTDGYDDEARWDYIQTRNLEKGVVRIYRDTVRRDLTEFTKKDPTRELIKIDDPSFRPVEEFITNPEELATFRERVRRTENRYRDGR